MTPHNFAESVRDAAADASRAAVPFLDVRAPYVELRADIDAAVQRTLGSGWYVLGEELRAFEREFAAFLDVQHTVGVANGLDALTLALRALNVGPGDDVLVPSNTYIATWLAVTQVGARPVPVEPELATYNLDPTRLSSAMTPKTRAIMPVHLYGLPADMREILAFAQAHDLLVIEDAAHAHGARYRGQRIGGFGDATAWSFYPAKNLGGLGDGGAVTTNRADVDASLRIVRNYGSSTKYFNEVRGTNSRLDELQAAVLRVKLAVLDSWNARRSAQAERYRSALASTTLALPVTPAWTEPVWHVYVIRVPGGGPARDALQAHLSACGVGTIIHYPIPPHRQEAYADAGIAVESLPIANQIAEEVLSLPIGPHLTAEQQERVIAAVLSSGIV